MVSFRELGLAEPLLRAVAEQGYEVPTPVQVQAIPHVLAGRDVLGCAQTGTGKTAAFALPVLQRLAAEPAGAGRAPRALVVSPTRELAAQIGDDVRAYGRHLRLDSTVVFGGVGQTPQVNALRRGVDLLVATPGRLLDLLGQRHVRLDQVSVLVLDEADRMLDMGFLPDVRRIIAALPARRQTLLFSATMPPEIAGLADQLLVHPARVAVARPATAADTVRQAVLMVTKEDKPALLAHLLVDPVMQRTLVFTRTKHGADRVCHKLERHGIAAAAIHGDKSQNARTRALDQFRRGAVRVLVASDIAARGLDIDDVTHVVNYDVPNEPDTYVHRIGRTGRAGARGDALSLCSHEERGFLRAIERIVQRPIEVVRDHPYHAEHAAAGPRAPAQRGGPARREAEQRGGALPRRAVERHSEADRPTRAARHGDAEATSRVGRRGDRRRAAAAPRW